VTRSLIGLASALFSIPVPLPSSEVSLICAPPAFPTCSDHLRISQLFSRPLIFGIFPPGQFPTPRCGKLGWQLSTLCASPRLKAKGSSFTIFLFAVSHSEAFESLRPLFWFRLFPLLFVLQFFSFRSSAVLHLSRTSCWRCPCDVTKRIEMAWPSLSLLASSSLGVPPQYPEHLALTLGTGFLRRASGGDRHLFFAGPPLSWLNQKGLDFLKVLGFLFCFQIERTRLACASACGHRPLFLSAPTDRSHLHKIPRIFLVLLWKAHPLSVSNPRKSGGLSSFLHSLYVRPILLDVAQRRENHFQL